MKPLTAALAAALMLAALGCGEHPQTPNEPGPSQALASAAPLVFRVVTTGRVHSCGVTADDRAYCWGNNGVGGLGDGSTINRTIPVAVAGGLRFSMVSAGSSFTCGITTQGRAYCWGVNDLGQLGDGTRTRRHQPVPVAGGLLFRHIRPGSYHTCGVTTADVGYCWGHNLDGQLGDGTKTTRLTPTRVSGTRKFRRVIAGHDYSCGLTLGSRAFCWGSNLTRALGTGRDGFFISTPTPVAGGLSFKQVVPGRDHTCGVTLDHRAYCWGFNWDGQLGDGSGSSRNTPVRVAGSLRYAGISAAGYHTCGVTLANEAACWGRNSDGQLGRGYSSEPPSSPPQRVPMKVDTGLRFRSFGGGVAEGHACAVAMDGKAYCWGANDWGQLGDGTLTQRNSPVAVAAP